MSSTLFLIIGAFLYRYRGMAKDPKWYNNRQLLRGLFALPFAIYAYTHPAAFDPLGVALVVFMLTFFGVATGHGRGMDLGDTDKGEPETLEFTITWLKDRIPLFWYDMILLSVTGLAVTLPAGIATLNPALAVSGALKGPAYAIAKFGDTGTDGGELLTGAVLWGALLIGL